MQLSQISVFVLIAKHNSLAKAAHELGISPPAVSKQLSNLEAELGIRLIERTTRTLTLTDAGECFLEQSERVLEELEATMALATKLKAPPKGSLKVVASLFFGYEHIFPHLDEFTELYPDIRLDIELAERVPDLHAEGIDVLIGMTLKAFGEMVQKPIMKTKNLLVASPKYLEKYGTPEVPQDLLGHRFITHRARSPDNKLVFANKERVTLRPFLKLNNTRAMSEVVENGIGFALLHEYIVGEQLKNGSLIEVLKDHMKSESDLYIAYPKKRFISRSTRCFIDFFVGKIQGDDYVCI